MLLFEWLAVGLDWFVVCGLDLWWLIRWFGWVLVLGGFGWWFVRFVGGVWLGGVCYWLGFVAIAVLFSYFLS